jgi:hypothetical protein
VVPFRKILPVPFSFSKLTRPITTSDRAQLFDCLDEAMTSGLVVAAIALNNENFPDAE